MSLAVVAANPTPETFAGQFFGTMTERACESQDALPSLRTDGHYTLQMHCQDDLQATPVRRGRWSVTWNGTCVQLSPQDDARILELAIHDDDLLVLTAGSCIEPVEDPRGRTLRRVVDDRGND